MHWLIKIINWIKFLKNRFFRLENQTLNHHFLLLALYLVYLINQYVWLKIDMRPLGPWDPGRHYIESLQFLKSQTLSEKIHWFLYGKYPPFAQQLVVNPFYMIFGHDPDKAVMVLNGIFLAILFLSVFKIGQILANKASGLLAVFILAVTYPITFIHAKTFMLDLPLMSMCALAFLMLLSTDHFNKLGYSVLFGLSSGFGMLTKWTFFLFLAGPFFIYLFQAAKLRWNKTKASQNLGIPPIVNILISLLVSVGVAAIWYGPKWPGIFQLLLNNASSFFVPLNVYLRSFINTQSVILLVFSIFISYRFAKKQKHGIFMLGGWIIIPFILFALKSNRDPRHIYSVFPALALITSIGLVKFKKSWLRRIAISSLLLISLVQFLSLSYGTIGLDPLIPNSFVVPYVGKLNIFPSSAPAIKSIGLEEPRRGDWKLDQIIGRISENEGIPKYTVLVNFIHPYLKRGLPYTAVLKNLPLDFTYIQQFVPYEHSQLQKAIGQIISGNYDYILFLKKDSTFVGKVPHPSRRLNNFLAMLASRFYDNQSHFRFMEKFVLPDDTEILLYKNEGLRYCIPTNYGYFKPQKIMTSNHGDVIEVSRNTIQKYLSQEDLSWLDLKFPCSFKKYKSALKGHIFTSKLKSKDNNLIVEAKLEANDGEEYMLIYRFSSDGRRRPSKVTRSKNQVIYNLQDKILDGKWHRVIRNLEKDLFQSVGVHLDQVRQVTIKGPSQYYISDLQITEGTAEGKRALIEAPAGVRELDLSQFQSDSENVQYGPGKGITFAENAKLNSSEFKLDKGTYMIDILAKLEGGSDDISPQVTVSTIERDWKGKLPPPKTLAAFTVSGEKPRLYSTKFTLHVSKMVQIQLQFMQSHKLQDLKKGRIQVKSVLVRKIPGNNPFFTSLGVSQWGKNQLAFMVGNSERRIGILSQKALRAAKKWHHVAVVFENYLVRFYVDGKLRKEKSLSLRPCISTSKINIGRAKPTGGGFELQGKIGSLSIYAKSLKTKEIQKLAKREERESTLINDDLLHSLDLGGSDIPTTVSLPSPLRLNNNFTISFWIKPHGEGDRQTILQMGSTERDCQVISREGESEKGSFKDSRLQAINWMRDNLEPESSIALVKELGKGFPESIGTSFEVVFLSQMEKSLSWYTKNGIAYIVTSRSFTASPEDDRYSPKDIKRLNNYFDVAPGIKQFGSNPLNLSGYSVDPEIVILKVTPSFENFPLIEAPAGVHSLKLEHVPASETNISNQSDQGIALPSGEKLKSEAFSLTPGTYVVDVHFSCQAEAYNISNSEIEVSLLNGVQENIFSQNLNLTEDASWYSTKTIMLKKQRRASVLIAYKQRASTDKHPIKVKGVAIRKIPGRNPWFTEFNLYAQWTNDRLAFVVGNDERKVGLLSDKGLQFPNKWHHIVVTYRNNKVKYYIDGELAGTDTVSLKPSMNIRSLVLGANVSANAPSEFHFSGMENDVRIYNRALTASEIEELFRQGQEATKEEAKLDLVKYWIFNDGEVQTSSVKLGDENVRIHGASLETDKFGTAFKFDGIDDYVKIVDTESSRPIMDQFTISAWIKPDLLGNRQVLIQIH